MTDRSWSAAIVAGLVVLGVVAVHQAHRPAIASRSLVLPERLADTGLYSDAPQAPGDGPPVAAGALAFSPQYPLWSDGLTKRRWILLPVGSRIDGGDEHAWTFPVGTRLWKEFSFNGRRVETRMLWKTSEAGWTPATYVWNDEGTDAVLAPEHGAPAVVELAPGRRHPVPSRSDCGACHGAKETAPLGFNALQLSPDRDPHAIHGEALQPGMLTLEALVDSGLLAGSRADLIANPPRIRTTNPATRAVLGYLSTNCGVCHNGGGEISALGPTLPYADLLEDADEVARRLVGQPTRWQLPGAGDGETVLVHAGVPARSALVARMRSRSPSSQMPPLGTVIRDEMAVEAVTRWIADELGRSH
jgi:hypothetical protein